MSIHFRNFRSKYFYHDDKPTNLLLFCSKSNLFSQALADVTEEFQSLYKNTKKKILSDPPTSHIPSHDHNIHESRREASRSRMRTRSGGEIRSPSVSPERSPELPEIGSPASTASEGIPASPQPEKEQDPGSWNNGAEQFCTVEFHLYVSHTLYPSEVMDVPSCTPGPSGIPFSNKRRAKTRHCSQLIIRGDNVVIVRLHE